MKEAQKRNCCQRPSSFLPAILPFIRTNLIVHAFSQREAWLTNVKEPPKPVVVVGKVILDEYGNPDDFNVSKNVDVTVGGGGPQAAWGAAAALAVITGADGSPPPPQPVTFIGPVGGDWTTREEDALNTLLGPSCEWINLVRAHELRTPRIQIWHDKDQIVQWRAVDGSFGPDGADSLWRNRPSASDILSTKAATNDFILHTILEAGANAPGNGYDAAPLSDPSLKEHVSFLSVEPVAFLNDSTGEVSVEDAESCNQLLGRLSSTIDFVCPDDHLHRSLDRSIWQKGGRRVAVRDGERGSKIFTPSQLSTSTSALTVPAAKLLTPNGQPVNPTGAGNAYSAAAAACLGIGLSIIDSSCVATAVGAVVCEHENLPPWSSAVLKRIDDAAKEVRGQVLR